MASNHQKLRKKMRKNADGDRLSNLPNELIHKILSFLNKNEAIQTSVLSSRWLFVWTSMPHLNFSSEGFSTLPKFCKFVKHVMSRLMPRNNLTKVYSVKLSLCGTAGKSFIKKVLDHILSHNIQQLDVVFVLKNRIEFPLSSYSSESLKHLRFCMSYSHLTSSLELPALTTLDLSSVTLCDDNADTCIGVFSKCTNLENLTLNKVDIKGSNGLCISHPRVSNLTLENICYNVVIILATPQLKNLTIRSFRAKLVISAPSLTSLLYEGSFPWRLSTESFSSLEKANLCFQGLRDANAQELVCLLQQLHSVKFLTLNLEIVELLSSTVGLFSHQTSPFLNLKSLNIYPHVLNVSEQAPKKVAMSAELKSYLLNNSPGCVFTMVLREEIEAQKLMAKLRRLLAKENAKLEKAPLETYESETEMRSQFESCWGNLAVQIEQSKKDACRIVSKLQHIKELLIELPASHRAKMQPCFSSLCAEVDNTISKITHFVTIQCEKIKVILVSSFMNLQQNWWSRLRSLTRLRNLELEIFQLLVLLNS